jgi:acylglycerol lipase
MQHQEGNFKGQKELNLYYQSWLPDGKPKAVLLIVHGLAEHSGRYGNLVDYFLPKGYALYSLDHQGHGKSEGLRGYVSSFSDYVIDLKTFFDLVRRENKHAKIFLIGHSMGGLIATTYAIKHQNELAGLVLSSPTLKVGSSVSRRDMIMARVCSALFPKLPIAGLDSNAISKDKKVVQAYVNDPLVYTGKIRARLACEIINAMNTGLQAQMPKIELPILIMQGSKDSLSNPEGSALLFKLVASKEKTLNPFEGLYHELFNEPERTQVMEYMENWLKERI